MLEAYFGLIFLSVLLLGSPGPAPIAIAATGILFGLRKGLNFLFGLLLGFLVVLLAQSLSLWFVIGENQGLMRVLQVFGFVYIIYLAFKIARAPLYQGTDNMGSPPTLFDGLVLNVINPKAHAAVVIILSQKLLPYEKPEIAYLLTALVCFMVVVFIDVLWLLMGQLLRPWMQDPKVAKRVQWLFVSGMISMVLWALIKNI